MKTEKTPYLATGLTPGPSLFWGALVFVPLLRTSRSSIALRLHQEQSLPEDCTHWLCPHGVVWEHGAQDKLFKAFLGTQLFDVKRFKATDPRTVSLRIPGTRPDTFLPEWLRKDLLGCHLMEADFLGNIIVASGTERGGRAAALREAERREELRRLLEPHPNQVGMFVYAAGTLLSGMVLPRADDWKQVHEKALDGLWGLALDRYGLAFQAGERKLERIPEGQVHKAEDLPLVVSEWKQRQHAVHSLAEPFFQPFVWERSVPYGAFVLRRFYPWLDETQRFVGEAIYNQSGALEYLHFGALVDEDARRFDVLRTLASRGWNATQRTVSRMVSAEILGADLSYLFKLRRQRG